MAKIHRFIDNFDLSKKPARNADSIATAGGELEITGEIAKQMALVLKLKVGEKIELCDGKGVSAVGEIVEINKKKVVVKISTFLRQGYERQNSTKQVNLFCAVLKKENFELVVQKATECGVSKIIPIITERTIKTGINLERLQKIAKEASEQSGRTIVPEIREPIIFTKAIENLKSENILFDSSGDSLLKMHGYFSAEKFLVLTPSRSQGILNSESHSETTVNIFIGPEGGWTEKEIKFAKENNFKIASLGPLTLRGETAAIIATYLIKNL